MLLCPTLCDLMDCSRPGSSGHGIFQARTLEWVAISSPGHLPDPGIKRLSLVFPALAGRFLLMHHLEKTRYRWFIWEVISGSIRKKMEKVDKREKNQEKPLC